MRTKKDIRLDIKSATKMIAAINREMRTASFKKLSKYSKGLLQTEYNRAVEKHIELIQELLS